MKIGDLGHMSKDWAVHFDWSVRIYAEFFDQGKREKEMGLPVLVNGNSGKSVCLKDSGLGNGSNIAQSRNIFLIYNMNKNLSIHIFLIIFAGFMYERS
jgi:hypothetical protein